jgi:hypothetical protein
LWRFVSGGNSFTPKRAALAASIALLLSSTSAFAQTNAMAASHGYVFVVETSKAMQKRAQGVHDTLKALLDSNLTGQLHPGDSFSVWTFNDSVSTNFFPAQPWSAATRSSIGGRLPDFREPITYEKRAALDKLLPPLNAVLANSDLLTVVLITTGDDEIQGTPFDNQLKRAFAQWRSEQQKARMPILTLLRGSRGHFSQWSVTGAPWPLEIPPLEAGLSNARPKPADSKTTQPPTNALSTRGPGNPSTAPKTNALTVANSNGVVSNATPVATVPPKTPMPVVSPPDAEPAGGQSTKTNVPSSASAPHPAKPDDSNPISQGESAPKIAFTVDNPRRDEGPQPIRFTHTEEPVAKPEPKPEPLATVEKASLPLTQEVSTVTSTPSLIPPVDDPSSTPPMAPTQIAMTPMTHNFLRENAKWLVGACLAGIGCIFCALLWLSTYNRNQINLASFGGAKKPRD